MITSLGSDAAERFRRAVARRFGLQFDDSKVGFLEDLLGKRLEATESSCTAYLAALENDPPGEETRVLARELTIGETYFFRNIEQFQAFTHVAVPDRVRAAGYRRKLRLLSAGCASGEEAYSIAIAIRETLADPSWEVSIRAVDINPNVLQKAKHAQFTSWALRGTPPETQDKWFRRDGGRLILADAARTAVVFDERNLALDDAELWPPNTYDVVFCRNVIMYFTAESARALIARIANSLAPGGYLFLGHAETLRGLSQQFHLCHTHGTFYYQRKDGATAEAPRHPGDRSLPSSMAPVLANTLDGATWIDAIGKASDRIETLTRPQTPGRWSDVAPRRGWDLTSALNLLQRERFTDALAVVRNLPPEAASDPEVLLLLAVLEAHGGQLAAAEATCHQLLAIDELSAGAHYVLALCRDESGDRQGSTRQYQVAAYLDPTFAMPRLHLGLSERRAGNRDGAQRELGQALLLLQREDASRLVLFGGGFNRDALVALCRAELQASGGGP